MRFNILSLGLVATVFLSASARAIPVGDTPGGVGSAVSDVGGILGGLTKEVSSSFTGYGAVDTVSGRIRKRDVGDTGAADGAGNGAGNGANGAFEAGAGDDEGNADVATDSDNDFGAGGADGDSGAGDSTAGGAINTSDNVSNATGGLRKRDVRDTASNLGNSGVRDTTGNIADSVTNGGLSDTIADTTSGFNIADCIVGDGLQSSIECVTGSSAPEAGAVNKRSFSLSRRRLLQRRTDAAATDAAATDAAADPNAATTPSTGAAADEENEDEEEPEEEEPEEEEEEEGLTRRSPDGDDVEKEENFVRRKNSEDEDEDDEDETDENDKGKRKRSVAGEPDEEEADEEEPEEEETDEEEADELGASWSSLKFISFWLFRLTKACLSILRYSFYPILSFVFLISISINKSPFYLYCNFSLLKFTSLTVASH